MDNLKEERLQILELLRSVLSHQMKQKNYYALMDKPEQELITVPNEKKQSFRMLKIIVDTADGEKVRINIPVEFAKLLKKWQVW